jgi:hypothetical protein
VRNSDVWWQGSKTRDLVEALRHPLHQRKDVPGSRRTAQGEDGRCENCVCSVVARPRLPGDGALSCTPQRIPPILRTRTCRVNLSCPEIALRTNSDDADLRWGMACIVDCDRSHILWEAISEASATSTTRKSVLGVGVGIPQHRPQGWRRSGSSYEQMSKVRPRRRKRIFFNQDSRLHPLRKTCIA